jgi:hypothetical protein
MCLSYPAAGQGAPAAKIDASFEPLRLGSPTAVLFAFQIAPNGAPALLTGVRLAYPSNLGIATSGLGVAACSPATIEAQGALACPANSRMGSGTAVAQVPFGPFLVKERVRLLLLAGPSPDGYLQLLIGAIGEFPVSARLILAGKLLAGHLDFVVPPIPGLPEGPYVAVTSMRLTLGGRLTYYERIHGRTVAYHPPGIGLPRSCPRRGFPFAAAFTFLDGTSASASTAVRCPHKR